MGLLAKTEREKNKESPRDLCDNNKRFKMHVIGIVEIQENLGKYKGHFPRLIF